jgi:hypothetical protein
MNYKQIVVIAAIGGIAVYSLARLIFWVLFRGFSPWFPYQSELKKTLLNEILAEKVPIGPNIYSIGAGKLGFLGFAGKHLPGSKSFAITSAWGEYVLSMIQKIAHPFRVKLIRQPRPYELDITNANIIFFSQDAETLHTMAKKLKFECKRGTVVVSMGALINGLTEKRLFELTPKPNILFSALILGKKGKAKKAKASEGENMVYLYVI